MLNPNPIEVIFVMKGFQLGSTRGVFWLERVSYLKEARRLFEEAARVEKRMQEQLPILVNVR